MRKSGWLRVENFSQSYFEYVYYNIVRMQSGNQIGCVTDINLVMGF
jgi:hypothetical protein